MTLNTPESVRDPVTTTLGFFALPTIPEVFSRPVIPLYISADPGFHWKPVTGI